MRSLRLTRVRVLALAGALVALFSGGYWCAQTGRLSVALPIPHSASFGRDTRAYPSRLQVRGPEIVDRDSNPVVLHGLMAPDPARLAERGQFDEDLYAGLADAGASAVRVPVHPERWERDPDYLWRYLDPIVAWNGDKGVYTILDLHFIGNIETGEGSQMPDLRQPPKAFTLAFWRQVAGYFVDVPSVIFEIYNEPAGISASDWRAQAQEIVGAIRETGARQLIVVGGVEYARDVSWVEDQPVADDNIAYAAHIFPAHRPESWDTWFGNVAQDHPVLVTEWGWTDSADDPANTYLVGDQNTYGEPLLAYLNERRIGWVACWYDDEWLPPMFESGFSQRTAWGAFILDALSDERRP